MTDQEQEGEIRKRIMFLIEWLDNNHDSDSWEFNKNGIINRLEDVLKPDGWTARKMKE
jgi:hypothetical protein